MIIARVPRLLALAATIAAAAAWVHFYRLDLVLSHYDAKAHLVVARRVIDSLTPGWQQVGAVWLPLPHLIQLLPTQVDLFYRTGLFGSLVSVLCLGVTAHALARLVLLTTGSAAGAAVSTAMLALNPNLLYLHATPMTEPLLLAIVSTLVLWLYEWSTRRDAKMPTRIGVLLFAAAWTRYEAWAVIGAALAAVMYASWRQGLPRSVLLRRGWDLGKWPAAAVLLFLINSRVTVGAWFVTGGFYVPDPTYQGKAWRTLVSLWWGTHELSGYTLEVVALAAAVFLAIRALLRREDAALLVPLALFAAAALPFYAFYSGHPYRIRYLIPIVAACAGFSGIAVGLARRGAPLLAAVLVASALVESPFWDPRQPMLEEAQWDRPFGRMRQRNVTSCLVREYRGERILVSMGSLAHYMQEMSREGFDIADFIHEGNGGVWDVALEQGPARHAGWMLVEERAEGGDMFAQRIAADAAFARDMVRVCEGGGVALYRRVAR